MERLSVCAAVVGSEPNFINVDYWQKGAVPETVQKVNAARAERRRLLA